MLCNYKSPKHIINLFSLNKYLTNIMYHVIKASLILIKNIIVTRSCNNRTAKSESALFLVKGKLSHRKLSFQPDSTYSLPSAGEPQEPADFKKKLDNVFSKGPCYVVVWRFPSSF